VKTNKTTYTENETIMPSYEIIINRKYTEFSKVWNECKILVHRNYRAYMEQQQKPVKLRLGVELTILDINQLKKLIWVVWMMKSIMLKMMIII
jgi:hypothetical protein